MPAVSVSMVCESTTANVTAALRESLSGGVSSVGGSGSGNNASRSSPVTATIAAAAAAGTISDDAIGSGITTVAAALMLPNGSCTTTANGGLNTTNDNDDDCLQSKLVASAKRVLLSKVDYEEVDNYGQSVLDTLKSKYIVLKPNALMHTNNIANGTNGNNNNTATTTSSTENGRASSPATCHNSRGSCTAAATASGGVANNSTNLTNGGEAFVNNAPDCNGICIALPTATTTATTTAGAGAAETTKATSATAVNNRANCLNVATTCGGVANSKSIVSGAGNAAAANATATGVGSLRRPNAHELPQPKRILFPRENVRIGWKNGTRKWQIGVGMMNVGNTCYLNSTLQAIFHVPSMANWLASESQHMERCDGGGGDGSCIICAVCKTLLMAQTHTSPIRPYYVYSKLRTICKHLVMGRQEDAHEFLRYLVEAMEKSYLSRFRNHKELDQYSKETTPMNQILGGYLKSAVRCLACNHVSVTFQHFQDLLLDIRKADTVEEALDGYFSRERLEDMGYKCESCKKKVSATKQFTLERAPIALCIQLKRFSMMGSKLNKQIVIRPRLDLSKYLTRRNSNEQYTYKLVSMITHLGASQHCGHYTAIGLTESGAYYNFDDSCVRPISVQGVCNTNAYIMFYEMDNPPALSAHTAAPTSSTQSSNLHLRDNERSNGNSSYPAKTNGMPMSVKNMNNIDATTPSHQRMIGPQLPPGGLQSYSTSTAATNGTSSNGGIKLKNVLSNCSNVNATNNSNANGNGNGNSKIMIHFKNGQATIKSNASSTTTALTTSLNSCSTTSTSSPSLNSNKSTNNTNQSNGKCTTTTAAALSLSSSSSSNQQNGLHAGTGKFQESSNTKSALGGASGKGGCNSLEKISNIAESSCSSEPEIEDGVSSTTVGYSECTMYEVVVESSLPSMPNLFDDDVEKSKPHQTTTATTTINYDNNKICRNSLVPYDLESDDDNTWNTTTKRQDNQSFAIEKTEKITENLLSTNKQMKRNNSNNNNITSIENSNNNGSLELKVDFSKSMKVLNNCNNVANNDATNRTSSPQSKLKSKTENPIDNIFNASVKGNGGATNGSNSNGHNGVKNTNNNKSLKRKLQSPQNALPTADSPTTPTYDEYDIESGEKSKPNVTPPSTPFKRAHLSPSSPPLIQTKTGLWQVTTINTEDSNEHNCEQPKRAKESQSSPATTAMSPSSPATPPKTWTNPFSSKASTAATENNGKSNSAQTPRQANDKRMLFSGNGYKSGLATDATALNGNTGNTVSELLQQSHRGYGAPVLKWNGDQNDIEQEIKIEVREQRQQDLNDEDENEMDRGRQKKVKVQSHLNDPALDRTPGFNPFQEQDNQRRWKSNGNSNNNSTNNATGSNPYRYYNSNYRQQPYQRNKFKYYQRYNYNKYQRPVQQPATGGQRHNAELSNCGSSSNSNNSLINNYTSRRES